MKTSKLFYDRFEDLTITNTGIYLQFVANNVLVISQFTLCADIKKGNRPSFIESAPPAEANRLYEFFCEKLRENGVSKVATGVFAADMKVEIENDGPVTILYDTAIWRKNGN